VFGVHQGAQERHRTQKHTNKGMFSWSVYIGGAGRALSTKTRQRGRVFVFGVHQGAQERHRTQKHTNKGVFSWSVYIGGAEVR